MGLFSKKKRGYDEAEEEKVRFFSQSEVEYTIPESRKPVVIKKEKPADKKTKKAQKPAQKKEATPAKDTKKKKSEKEKLTVEKKKPTAPKAATPKAKPETKPETKPKAAAAAPVEEKAARAGSFDIKKSKDGRYVFNLYSANRVIIATSQIYSSSQSALTGAKSVMANAIKAEIEDTTLKKPSPKAYPKWEIYIDRAGEYRFRLNASNASCICHAKAGYASKSNCKRAIESIIRLAKVAQIDKSYIGDKK